MAVLASVFAISELGQRDITLTRHLISEAEAQSARINKLLGFVVDAETGQRGFILTRRDSYLSPYRSGLSKAKAEIDDLTAHYNTAGDVEGGRRMVAISILVGEKFSELGLVVNLAEKGDSDAAFNLINSDVGRNKMMDIRNQAEDLIAYNNARAQALRQRAVDVSDNWRLLIAAAILVNAALLLIVYWRLGRAWRRKERQTENLKMQQAYLDQLVQERTTQLEDLSNHLQHVIEDEKTRLARELHDELGSILTAAKMDVAWVRRSLGNEAGGLGEKLERTIRNIDQGITVKRRLIEDLRPSTLTTFGLVVAARELVEESASRNNWDLQLTLPEENLQVDNEAATSLYRILQESLNNATKYAKAKSLQVRLVCEQDMLKLDVIDDGAGFDVHAVRPKVHGLLGMRQRVQARGGTFEIHSQPGRGCHINVVMPFNRDEQFNGVAQDDRERAAV